MDKVYLDFFIFHFFYIKFLVIHVERSPESFILHNIMHTRVLKIYKPQVLKHKPDGENENIICIWITKFKKFTYCI